jgi:hypothetical protein
MGRTNNKKITELMAEDKDLLRVPPGTGPLPTSGTATGDRSILDVRARPAGTGPLSMLGTATGDRSALDVPARPAGTVPLSTFTPLDVPRGPPPQSYAVKGSTAATPPAAACRRWASKPTNSPREENAALQKQVPGSRRSSGRRTPPRRPKEILDHPGHHTAHGPTPLVGQPPQAPRPTTVRAPLPPATDATCQPTRLDVRTDPEPSQSSVAPWWKRASRRQRTRGILSGRAACT